jgi:hypothetical protein
VLIPPGTYNVCDEDYDMGQLYLDTDYIDLVGMVPVQMTRKISQLLNTNDPTSLWKQTVAINPCPCGVILEGDAPGVVVQAASNVRLANLIICNTDTSEGSEWGWWGSTYAYDASYASSTTNTIIEHVLFIGASPGYAMNGTFAGVYRDCIAENGDGVVKDGVLLGGSTIYGNDAFGGDEGVASGTFEDCVAGTGSFGSVASGTFRNCTVFGSYSFGYVTASGFFENCYCGGYGFGGNASGTFVNCYAGGDFARGIVSGKFVNCVGGNYSFGTEGGEYTLTPSAVLIHCVGGTGSFGGFGPSADFNYSTNYMDLHIQIHPQGDLSMGTFTQ